MHVHLRLVAILHYTYILRDSTPQHELESPFLLTSQPVLYTHYTYIGLVHGFMGLFDVYTFQNLSLLYSHGLDTTDEHINPFALSSVSRVVRKS
jgi:hypothetical protein